LKMSLKNSRHIYIYVYVCNTMCIYIVL
jgi:hypothetical protein